MEVAHLGVQPFDAMFLGIHQKTSFPIGMSVVAVSLFLVFSAIWITKQPLKIGTVLDAVCLGGFLDLLLYLDVVKQAGAFIGEVFFS